MATRNRTPLYRKYRDALRSVRIPSVPSPSSYESASSSSRNGPVIEMASTSLLRPNRSYTPLSTEDPSNSSRGAAVVGLPPAWVDLSEEISGNIQLVRTKMSELVKAHTKALMPSFGDGKEDQHTIEVLTQDITSLLKKSEKQLKRLSASGPSEDANVRKNVQISLATDLQHLSMDLRKKQSVYLKRLRQQKEGQDGDDLEMNLNGSSSRYEDDEFDDTGFDELQMSKLKKSEAFTREREREISQVVESVNELAQIMKDLSVLVIDQGTIIDRIDYNIQNVATSVEEGFKQLERAERTQRKGGMVMCATILVIMCFILLVLLAIPYDLEVASCRRARSPIAAASVENSLGGSIHRNYDLLHIVGEVQLPVHHCLLALPGVRKEYLTSVMSHTLTSLGINVAREAFDDTASTTEYIVTNNLRDIAAITSARVAELYGMQILADEIQDDSGNVTRFVMLAREPIIPAPIGPSR
ncbi:hypothetical protein J5N97_008229 [Dioscorea zingiberensis]|uniref:t-SNARE coiled-coil homology domain-containing protein n=1 Tax=Dioscorea zingiberensis TaxID=325984 RepID=A0A9D5DFL3_9LILI|nr:hypothetical protein J5N97_008229 [Dioscorea zingiberensis]